MDDLGAPPHDEPPQGWSVKYLQRVGPHGREAVRKHVTDNISVIVNANDPLMVTKTWDGKHTKYSLMGLGRALAGLKLHNITLPRGDSRLAQLKSELAEVTVSSNSTRASRRELKRKRRALEQARERFDAEVRASIKTTIYSVVRDMQQSITYDNLVFRPGSDARPNDFNLFRGYAAERLLTTYPDRYPDAVQPVLDHIKDALCAADERVYEFVLKFIAHVLKNPTSKCGVALLFYSKPGAGKNLFFTFLEALIGSDLVAVVRDDKSLTGEFNAHRANKLLILANELKNGGVACKDANVLNSMITDTADTLRCMSKDPCRVDSVSSLMMFTTTGRPSCPQRPPLLRDRMQQARRCGILCTPRSRDGRPQGASRVLPADARNQPRRFPLRIQHPAHGLPRRAAARRAGRGDAPLLGGHGTAGKQVVRRHAEVLRY